MFYIFVWKSLDYNPPVLITYKTVQKLRLRNWSLKASKERKIVSKHAPEKCLAHPLLGQNVVLA